MVSGLHVYSFHLWGRESTDTKCYGITHHSHFEVNNTGHNSNGRKLIFLRKGIKLFSPSSKNKTLVSIEFSLALL